MNEVTTPKQSRPTIEMFVGQVLPPDRRDTLFAGLPSHIKPEHFERNLSNAIMANPGLMSYNPALVFREVSKAAGLGLLLDPQLQEAYIIEAYNYKTKSKEPQLRVGYRGMTKLARQSGEISNIYAHEVCANDEFFCELGFDKKLVHKPNVFADRGPVIGYYAVAKFSHGEDDFEPMSVKQIHEIRDRSDAYVAFKEGKIRSTPWSTDEVEMAKKTVIRRLTKRLPQSPQMAAAQRIEDDAEDIEFRTVPAAHKPLPAPPQRHSQLPPPDDGFGNGDGNTIDHDTDTGEVKGNAPRPNATHGEGKAGSDFDKGDPAGRDHPKQETQKPAEADKAKRKPNGWPALLAAAKLVIEDGVFTKDVNDATNVGEMAHERDYDDADLVLKDGVITKGAPEGKAPAMSEADVTALLERFKTTFDACDSIDSLNVAGNSLKPDYDRLKDKKPADKLWRAAEARIMKADREAIEAEERAKGVTDPVSREERDGDAGEQQQDDTTFPGDKPSKLPPAGDANNDPASMDGPAYIAYAESYIAAATNKDDLKKRWLNQGGIRQDMVAEKKMTADDGKRLRALYNAKMDTLA